MDAIITAAGKNYRMINDFKKMNKTPIPDMVEKTTFFIELCFSIPFSC